MKLTSLAIKKQLRKLATPKKKAMYQRFFKTGPGEYSEGDIFIGVTVPETRKIANQFLDLPQKEIQLLLKSKIHEERLTGLLILVLRFKKAKETEREKIYRFYMKHLKSVNNWDLVDLTTPAVVGGYLMKRSKAVLYRLAKSKDLWERRVSIVATWEFIKQGKVSEVFKISKMLLADKHDLIHKAVGWMLREAGKKDKKKLEQFIKKNYPKIPRTALRYAIERWSPAVRKKYLAGKI